MPVLDRRQKTGDEIQGCIVEPVNVIEKKDQRMRLGREDGQQPSDQRLETELRFHGRQVRHLRLHAEHQFQFGDVTDEEFALRADSFAQHVPPVVQLAIALAQDALEQGAYRLHQRRVRRVLAVLLELSRGEQRSGLRGRAVHAAHELGFARTRVSGHENQFRHGLPRVAPERVEQRIVFMRAAKQTMRDSEVSDVVLRGRFEWNDMLHLVPVSQTTAQIGLETRGALITFRGVFGQQFQDDRAQHSGKGSTVLPRVGGLTRHVVIDPFDRIRRLEGQLPGEQLV
ncbi:MAG: hypothetical protein P4L92_00755 [Rudaea sp.]|nr:hypothetical protein [Rudaea sp.]